MIVFAIFLLLYKWPSFSFYTLQTKTSKQFANNCFIIQRWKDDNKVMVKGFTLYRQLQTFSDYNWSVRAASTSAAANLGISTNKILRAANWSSDFTFLHFYYKTIRSSVFEKAMLSATSIKTRMSKTTSGSMLFCITWRWSRLYHWSHPRLVIDILFLARFQEVQSGEQLVGFMLVKNHSYWLELIYRNLQTHSI